MSAAANLIEYPYLAELNDLFNRFRIANLNERYFAQVRDELEGRDLAIQILIAITTCIAFAILGVNEFLNSKDIWIVKLIAFLAATVAFLVSAIAPWLKLGSRINQAQVAVFAWSSAERQIDDAMRYIKTARAGDPEVMVRKHTADFAYQTASAVLAPTDQDNERVQKLYEEIKKQFPSDYVWTAL